MNAYQNHAAMLDALQVEQDDGSLQFIWNETPWKILPGGAKFGRKNDYGGFDLSCDLLLTCTTAQFGGILPTAGNQIIYLNMTFVIKFRTMAPEKQQLRIEADLLDSEK